MLRRAVNDKDTNLKQLTDQLSTIERANTTLSSENQALKQQLITLQAQLPSYRDPQQQKRHRLAGRLPLPVPQQQMHERPALDARHTTSGLSALTLAPSTSVTRQASTDYSEVTPGPWTASATSPTSLTGRAPTDSQDSSTSATMFTRQALATSSESIAGLPSGPFTAPPTSLTMQPAVNQGETRLTLPSSGADGGNRDSTATATTTSTRRNLFTSALTQPPSSSSFSPRVPPFRAARRTEAAGPSRQDFSSVAGLDEAGFRDGFNGLFRSVENWSKKFANIPNRQADQALPVTARALLSEAGDGSLREVILSRVDTRWCLVERAIVGYLMGLIHGYALLEQFSKEVGGRVDECVNQLHPGKCSVAVFSTFSPSFNGLLMSLP